MRASWLVQSLKSPPELGVWLCKEQGWFSPAKKTHLARVLPGERLLQIREPNLLGWLALK